MPQRSAKALTAANFTVTITARMARQVHSHHCGSGKAGSASERVFDVTSGDTVLPKDFDILAEVGGLRKVATIVDLADAAVRGPLKIPFASSKGAGKFNTIKAARRPNRRLDSPHGLAEKVAKLKNATPAVLPLCLPANDHWN